MNTAYKHLLFDLDRTIWDFETNAKEAVFEIYKHFHLKNFAPSFTDFYAQYQAVNEKMWEAYRNGNITKQNLADTRFHRTFLEFGYDKPENGKQAGKMYLEISGTKTNLFPHAREVLARLQQKYFLHILTNGFKEVQKKKLLNCGINNYFSTVITSEDAGYQKPDIRIFHHALKLIGTSPAECIMIGDDEKTDIVGAQNAGIPHIWFNPAKKIPQNGTQQEIQSLTELINLL